MLSHHEESEHLILMMLFVVTMKAISQRSHLNSDVQNTGVPVYATSVLECYHRRVRAILSGSGLSPNLYYAILTYFNPLPLGKLSAMH